MELREFVKEWISSGKDVMIQMPQAKPARKETETAEKNEDPFLRACLKNMIK